ncbi:MAG: hypothetical protein IBJ07_06520 [Rhizobiaceae bacterium]|nr:hypothetical protein [Rhizobiaceae bacterium]
MSIEPLSGQCRGQAVLKPIQFSQIPSPQVFFERNMEEHPRNVVPTGSAKFLIAFANVLLPDTLLLEPVILVSHFPPGLKATCKQSS